MKRINPRMLKIIEPKDRVLKPFSDNVNNLLTKNIENIVDKTVIIS